MAALVAVAALRPTRTAAVPTNTTSEWQLDNQAELLVELRPDISPEAWQQWAAAQGWTTARAFYPQDATRTDLDDYYTLNVPDADWHQLETMMATIRSANLADWVEPNEIIPLDVLPAKTVPKTNRQMGVDDPRVNEQWGMAALGMDKLYQLLAESGAKPRKRALVAILDTGVDANHEDLKANYRSLRKADDTDTQGHGTHCAGIAAAVTNNGRGVASFARTGDWLQVTSVRVLRAGGSGTQQDIIGGIIAATDMGADVLSLSLGGFSTQSRQRAYNQAVKYATDKGAIVVAAAGNSNRDAATYSPVNAEGVIGVAAVDEENQRAEFSNRVNRIPMGVAAPGVGIMSTKPGNNYAAHSGTSMATPFVSGLIGLMKSIRPDLTHRQAFEILNATGVPTRDTENTGKLVQPAAAVALLLRQGEVN
jgi:thermitase